ncbi:cofF [Symbiodinium microadriaticum]|nr:cofF [Symbiodinium microadriaticum]
MTSPTDPPSLQNLLTNQAQSAKSSPPTSKVTLGEARNRNKPATLRDRSPYRVLAAECIMPSGAKSNWRQVPERDLETIRSKPASSVKSCEKRGDALVFHLNLLEAKKATGFAYEMPFPRYIVADESGSWRSTRSTLQLFHVDDKEQFHPMGPAHSNHADIAEKGDGAFSHWRHAITSGPWCKSMLRFSTPKNVPLKKVRAMVAVVFPMVPPFGWIEFNRGKHVVHQEVFRELFLQTFPTAGVARPHLIDAAEDTIPNTRYVWRVGGNHEFELPLKDGELYEKRLPYQIVEWYEEFERRGGVLYPPPGTYFYYQNKVGLARLFIERKVKIPPTWVITSAEEAKMEKDNIRFPVVIKDPYGFSSLGLLQAANPDEFVEKMELYFSKALPDVEAIVQSKVIALKEARVTYVDGRPFHGYWRIRQSLKSASAASNLGGFQDFNFPLDAIAPYVAEFANRTGIPVGGVDFIWEEEDADVKTMPYTLEVSPTSDINPPAPLSWHKTYAEFKHTSGYRKAYLEVRRQWTEFMVLAVIDRYRRERRHLFVDIDNVVSLSMDRVRRWRGDKNAYKASEVMKDVPVPGAADALRRLREQYFIRFLTARGSYEDPFNVTQTWLELNDFEYDELIVVDRPQSKVCHLTPETILVDDFTQGHEKEEPSLNQKFMDKLSAAKLPFVRFPLGGSWEEIMPQLVR